MSGPALLEHVSEQTAPADFDEFWEGTLAEARSFDLDVTVEPVASTLRTVDVYDVTFSGFGGHRIRAWLRLPHGARGPLPTMVQFVGYGGGRGEAEENLFWASSGFAHLHMDTRGQGATWSRGATPDVQTAGPRFPGMMTAGIQSREEYYYRRVITDAVRAIETAAGLPQVDASRIVAIGGSQGGGLALAATALSPLVSELVAYVPFLCDFPRAIQITDNDPYKEISRYLAVHRSEESAVLETLRYFDGVNFARRASAPAWFTTALMDPICPPSTVVGAYNAYAGPKQLTVYTHNSHEGGGIDDDIRIARALQERFGL
nr:acetylxylan esterase [Galbitalea soli]